MFLASLILLVQTSYAGPTLATQCVVVDSEDFEAGTGIWNDGGGNATYFTNGAFANSGTDYLGFSGNTGSSWTTNSLNLSSYSSVRIDFSFISTTNQEVEDRFVVEYNTGSEWINAESFVPINDFTMGARTDGSVTITGNFSTTTRIRFRGGFSTTTEWIYVDDVVISGCVDDCTVESQDGFESNMGNWIDGGLNCRRVNFGTYASTGNISVRLRGNNGSSNMRTYAMDLSSYDNVQLSFFFYTTDNDDTNDQFMLDISSNNGASYSNVETYTYARDYRNQERYTRTVVINGPFTANTRFRFRTQIADNDEVYFDDVEIKGCIGCNNPTVADLPDESICEGSFTLTQDPLQTGQTGIWTAEFGSPTIYSANAPTTVVDVPVGTSAGLRWTVSDGGCSAYDDVILTNYPNPPVGIESTDDDICGGNTSITLTAVSAPIPISPSSQTVTNNAPASVVHTIDNITSPDDVVLKITLDTWDDSFYDMRLNGALIFPESAQWGAGGLPDSQNPTGFNTQSPWVANSNGLPRTVITITSTSVTYEVTPTSNSTALITHVPTNWTTTPQPFVFGTNILDFGIRNTDGPAGGTWDIDIVQNGGYSYNWSDGSTGNTLTVAPTTTTDYSVTVTASTGCSSVSTTTINVFADTDGDLICDNVDEDDDNDGILDVDECVEEYLSPTFVTTNAVPNNANGPYGDPANTANGVVNVIGSVVDGFVYNTNGSAPTNPVFTYSLVVNTSITGAEVHRIVGGQVFEQITDIDLEIIDDATGQIAFTGSASGGSNDAESQFFNFNMTLSSGTYTVNLTDRSVPRSRREWSEIRFLTLPDTDGDGLANCLDPDSDGDGCNDAIEAGFTDSDQDGEVDGTGYASNGTVQGSDGYTGSAPPVIDANTNMCCSASITVDAGVDQSICQGEVVSLSGSIGGDATGLTWSTSGDGTFDDVNLSKATYTPGATDIANRSVTLTITTNDPDGSGGCVAESDDVLITIAINPQAGAGPDQELCLSDFCQSGDASCRMYFDNSGVNSVAGGQDADGTFEIIDDDYGITVSNNTWKAIDRAFTISAGTYLTFEFRSDAEVEEQVISFTNGNAMPPENRRFKVWGYQNTTSITDFTYAGSGNWESFTIPVGQYYTGNFDQIVFVHDMDATPSGTSGFRNIKVYDGIVLNASANSAGTWSGGLGTFADATQPNTTYIPDPSEYGTQITLTWTTTDTDGAGPCIAASDDVIITLGYQGPTDFTAPDILCESDTPITLTATPAGGTFSGPGVAGSTFDPSVPGFGDHTIEYTFTYPTGCTETLYQTIFIDASPCLNSNCTELTYDDFESGWGNWNDGGYDCQRLQAFANSPSHSIRLRDNDGQNSSMYSDPYDMTPYNEAVISFSYYTRTFDSNKDFALDMSLDGGATYVQIQNWVYGVDFINDQRYNPQVTISGYSFTNNTVFRIRGNGTQNNDRVFVDDVRVHGCVQDLGAPVLSTIESETIIYCPASGVADLVTQTIEVSDPNNSNLTATVTVGGVTGNGDILDVDLTAYPSSSATYSYPTLTISGTITPTEMQEILRLVTFETASNLSGIRDISFTVNNGTTDSNTEVRSVQSDENDSNCCNAEAPSISKN